MSSTAPTRQRFTPTPTVSRRTRHLIAAEWTKLLSVRSTWLTLLGTALIAIIIGWRSCGAAADHWEQRSPADQAAFDPVNTSLSGLLFAQLTIGLLGVLTITSEYGTGQIRTTLTVTPQRGNLLYAKALVLAGAALISAPAICIVAFLAGQAALGSHGVTLAHPGALRAVTGGGYSLLVAALVGLGLGTLIRHTAGAIAALFLILLVIDGFVRKQLMDTSAATYTKYLLLQSTDRITSLHDAANQPTQSIASAFAVLTGYAVAALAAGTVAITRRDA